MRTSMVAVLAVVFLVARAGPANAGSFVYVASCASTSCDSSEVDVYDQTTAALVTRIALPGVRRVSGMVLSRDGLRLYLSASTATGGGTMAVIDATSHALSAMFSTPDVGPVAVSRDGTRLFLAGVVGRVYDTGTFTQIATLSNAFGPIAAIDASPVRDRLYVLYVLVAQGTIVEYDSQTGAVTASPHLTLPGKARDVRVTQDGTRLLATTDVGISLVDVQSFQITHTFAFAGGAGSSLDVLSRHQVLTAFPAPTSSVHVSDADTLAAIADVAIASPGRMAASADESRVWVTTVKSTIGGVDALNVFDPATDAFTASLPLPGSSLLVAATPAGAKPCAYSVDTSHSAWTQTGGSAAIAVSTPCSWVSSSDQSWARVDVASGTGNATLTLTVDPNPTAANRRASVAIGGQIVNVVQPGFTSQPPFGIVDTPAENAAGVSGALNVTGWALDDVGVTRVRIYRDAVAGETPGLIYIGDGTFVEGARPDVQAAFAFEPNASRGGWGLQILTNMLPGQGNGAYHLTVLAEDVEGHTTVIGTRTFSCANATAVVPFGTIDTPGSGATVSGTVVNFGWALTPKPAVIPFDGSTIDVLIDGVFVGHPTYGFARSDIDTAFAGYANTGHAVGYFSIDTTQLSNGVHTIAWIVHDSLGATQGIGSRFFTVGNQ